MSLAVAGTSPERHLALRHPRLKCIIIIIMNIYNAAASNIKTAHAVQKASLTSELRQKVGVCACVCVRVRVIFGYNA